jgi:hypothetical protein
MNHAFSIIAGNGKPTYNDYVAINRKLILLQKQSQTGG